MADKKDLDERMDDVEARLTALDGLEASESAGVAPAATAAADDDSSLAARIAALEKEVFPPAGSTNGTAKPADQQAGA